MTERKGRHRDEGWPINRIIGIVETLQAVVSILLQRPDDARAITVANKAGVYSRTALTARL